MEESPYTTLKYEDPRLIQTVSRLALEKLVCIKHPLPSESPDPKQLTADEHNALRYAAGYVLLSLKRKLIHQLCRG